MRTYLDRQSISRNHRRCTKRAVAGTVRSASLIVDDTSPIAVVGAASPPRFNPEYGPCVLTAPALVLVLVLVLVLNSNRFRSQNFTKVTKKTKSRSYRSALVPFVAFCKSNDGWVFAAPAPCIRGHSVVTEGNPPKMDPEPGSTHVRVTFAVGGATGTADQPLIQQ